MTLLTFGVGKHNFIPNILIMYKHNFKRIPVVDDTDDPELMADPDDL